MSITEYERSQLFTWFEEHMGKERATTMMSLLPPVGWADVATRRDLDVLADRLDTKIDNVADRLDTKIDHVADRLDIKLSGRIDSLEARMATKDDLLELRSDLQRTFVTWMFAAQGPVVAAVAAMLVLIR